MKKIPSLFRRNYHGYRMVYNEVMPGAEWVLSGEGVATVKYDGTAVMVRGGALWKRYDVKKGRKVPQFFEPAQEADATTGNWPGWVPVGDGPEDRWHREAFRGDEPDGTYELVGPKINGNPDNWHEHALIPHGRDELPDAPRTFDGLRAFLSSRSIEGIVWHCPGGRMVKIKRRDFGLPWPATKEEP